MKICVTQAVWEHNDERIRATAPGADVVRLQPDGSFDASLEGVEHFFFSEDLYRAGRDAVAAAERLATSGLRWVHASAAGIDHPMFAAVIDSGAVLSHSPGRHSPPIAEYVIGYMLHWAKRMAAHAAAQRERAWRPLETEELTGKTLGIVGYGGIGRATAQRARAFGMRVVALRRSAGEDAAVDRMLGPEGLRELLESSDYVLLSVPLTDDTRGLIGGRELAWMRPGALLINVARAVVVDEQALIGALREGRLGGAVLDVAWREPLEPESPLWSMPNVVITPHDSGDSPLGFARTIDHWIANLARWVQGEPLLDVVESTGLRVAEAERELGLQ